MATNFYDSFATIRTEGALFPPEILILIAGQGIDGITPESFHLDKGERINEAVNRSWNRLRGVWASFRAGMEALAESDAGTTLTREKWLLKIFDELGYGRLRAEKAVEIEEKSYPISHYWGSVPIHLVGCKVELDKKTPGVAGAARHSPHGLVQEFLNRSEGTLWAFVSNGRRLRILRDNSSLTRQAYVEFDLEAMMEGEVFADFSLLWLLCHQSRVEAERPEECWLEKWSHTAQEEGTRALDTLREGVEKAISALGAGFIAHPGNDPLRENLKRGALGKEEYYRQLLRLIYQLIFLFVAEDRDLLSPPGAAPEAKQRYVKYYSTARLRRLAGRRVGTPHDDLFRATRLVIEKLGEKDGCEILALPPLSSPLFSPESTLDLSECAISNRDFLTAVRSLAFTTDRHGMRPISYKNLGSEELGSVYESLLELHPQINVDARSFDLKVAAGSERKTTGSYYTPTSLISCLLDSALDPVLEEACRKENPEQSILELKVCDPACGSGHFLVAAAHRLANRLASIRVGGDEPSSEAYRQAIRDVIGRCIYGVDINPMAVELCKVSLWMEALEPGKPLSFLEHRIRCGNSLIGATPALIAGGIPDGAFRPIEGDEREVVTALRRQNRREHEGQLSFFHGAEQAATHEELERTLKELNEVDDATIDGIKRKAELFRRMTESLDRRNAKLTADAWCSAFVWRKRKGMLPPITQDLFQRILKTPDEIPALVMGEIERIARRYRFFHWHLAFPDVFRISTSKSTEDAGASWNGGFDVVIGNPPWDVSQLNEQEFFATHDKRIANLSGAQRKNAIERLRTENIPLWETYIDEKRDTEATNHFIRSSGHYSLTAIGKLNTYALFADLYTKLFKVTGKSGIIVPSGIATDDSTKLFFDAIVSGNRLVSLVDFENRDGIFQGVHRSFKFCLLTLGNNTPAATFTFFLTGTAQLGDPMRIFTLTPEEIRLLNPNTRTCPVFRSNADAELTKKIYRNVPVLINEGRGGEGNPWAITFRQGLFNMTSDSDLFHTFDQLAEVAGAERDDVNWLLPDGTILVPLYEAKMIHQFDHRWATYETNGRDSRDVSPVEKRNPEYDPLPRYWVPEEAVEQRLKEKGWAKGWLIGWRDICRSTDERTVIASIIPRFGAGDTFLLMMPSLDEMHHIVCLLADQCSIIHDFIARQKIGGTHLKYHYKKQITTLPPLSYSAIDLDFIVPRVLELTYTSHTLRAWALDLGHTGDPFPWDPDRRALLRAELDAYYGKLYGLTRDELRYILDPADVYGEDYPSETFRVLKNNEIREYGEYRTRRLVLEAWDRLFAAESA